MAHQSAKPSQLALSPLNCRNYRPEPIQPSRDPIQSPDPSQGSKNRKIFRNLTYKQPQSPQKRLFTPNSPVEVLEKSHILGNIQKVERKVVPKSPAEKGKVPLTAQSHPLRVQKGKLNSVKIPAVSPFSVQKTASSSRKGKVS